VVRLPPDLPSAACAQGATLHITRPLTLLGACNGAPGAAPMSAIAAAAAPASACQIDASGGAGHAVAVKGAAVLLQSLVILNGALNPAGSQARFPPH
jgi:hypothetical protein